jgi:hypothetical protein
MRRPLAGAAAILRLRILSSSSRPLVPSPSPLHLLCRDDDREDRHPTPPSPPFSPRPLLSSAFRGHGLLGLRGWRTLPPAASPPRGGVADAPPVLLTISRSYSLRVAKSKKQTHFDDEHSHRAVNTALLCNFLVFTLKFGVWFSTSSHVMLAELVHSVADFANQVNLPFLVLIFLSCISFLEVRYQTQGLTAYQTSGSSCIWFEKFKTCSRRSTPVCITCQIAVHALLTNTCLSYCIFLSLINQSLLPKSPVIFLEVKFH